MQTGHLSPFQDTCHVLKSLAKTSDTDPPTVPESRLRRRREPCAIYISIIESPYFNREIFSTTEEISCFLRGLCWSLVIKRVGTVTLQELCSDSALTPARVQSGIQQWLPCSILIASYLPAWHSKTKPTDESSFLKTPGMVFRIKSMCYLKKVNTFLQKKIPITHLKHISLMLNTTVHEI